MESPSPEKKPPQEKKRWRHDTWTAVRGCLPSFSVAEHAPIFFHIEEEKPHHDEIGKELADDGVAWAQAVRMLRHTENGMQPGDNWTLRVFKGEEPIYVIAVVSRRY